MNLHLGHWYLAETLLQCEHLTIVYSPQLGHLNSTAPLSFATGRLQLIHIFSAITAVVHDLLKNFVVDRKI